MPDKVLQQIHQAFDQTPYPGDDFLHGSFDSCEPYDEIAPFKNQTAWQTIEPALLDARGAALSFFSEAGLRFFLPAYLIADLNDALQTADPLFTLTHGFSDLAVEQRIGAAVFVRRTGKSALVNPRRYGALTFFDYAHWRLSVFSREEAQAIVAYLRHKQETDIDQINTLAIEAALDLFWLERATNAPTSQELAQHLREEEIYLAAISEDDR